MKSTRVASLFVLFALALLPIVAHAQAPGGDNFERYTHLRFTRSAPSVAAASMVYQDSITFASSADTVRTSNINTDAWDWSSSSGATAVRAIAAITFWVPPSFQNTTYGDTINYVIEPSFDGGKTYVSTPHSWASLGSAGVAQSIGNYALKHGSTGFNGAASAHFGTAYRGFLMWDPDSPMTLAQTYYHIFGLRDFRLKIFGANAVVGAVQAYVYPLTQRINR